MLNYTDAQIAVLNSPSRELTLYCAAGVGIDQTSADDLSLDLSDIASFANTAQVTNAVYNVDNIAVFEGDGFSVASDSVVYCASMVSTDSHPQTGIYLDGISDANGNISDTLTLTFANSHTSALTLYFDGNNVPSAFTITYYKEGTAVKSHSATANTSATYIVGDDDPLIVTYNEIIITFAKVAKPYTHVRIAEIEFGASYTVGSEYVANGTSILYSYDPLGLTSSPHELDLSYINIGGTFDEDSPTGAYSAFSRENPIIAAITAKATINGTPMQVSVPLGRFYIIDRYVTGSTFNVTAQDARSLMQNVSPSVTFPTSEGVIATLQSTASAYGISIVLGVGATDTAPATAVSFTGDYDLLTIAQYAVQYLVSTGQDVTLDVGRNGSVTVRSIVSDTYGGISAAVEYEYPYVDTYDSYNVVSVRYGDNAYITTANTSGMPDERILVDNPFIRSSTLAQTLADRIKSRMMTSCRTVTMVGDPRMEVSDIVQMQSRYTPIGSAEEMVVTEIEMEYSGGLRCTVKGCTGGGA